MSAAPSSSEVLRRRIRIAELERRLGIERTTIGRWCRSGKLPPPHYLGNHRCWWLDEIVAWEAAEMARTALERRGAPNLSASSDAAAERAGR